jgi:hypothetical protein
VTTFCEFSVHFLVLRLRGGRQSKLRRGRQRQREQHTSRRSRKNPNKFPALSIGTEPKLLAFFTIMQPRVSRQDGFVESVDSLFGRKISPGGDDRFSVGPPLVMVTKHDKRSLKLLKRMCRSGLPPQLRCAGK